MSVIPSAVKSEFGGRVYSLMLELAAIPSVTGSDGGEDACARFIFDRLSKIDYFKRRPGDLRFMELENDPLKRHVVTALLRSNRKTKQTIALLGHFDVVDVDVCGPLREWAFDPAEYTARIGKLNLPEDARADLDSGNYVFGRGVSDMKMGVALGMRVLEDYAASGELDFNLLLLNVPDEEGDSVGMRGAAAFLAELQEREGLEYLACVNLEPAFEDGSPAIYFGTIGKIMPVYLCVGRESHAGSYREGLNSTLIASYLNISLDGAKDTEETFAGAGAGSGSQTFPPQCCLRMRDTRGRYAVTLPERTVLYYNCLTVSKTPAALLEEMKAKAMAALKAALAHAGHQDWTPRVLTVKEVVASAARAAEEKGENLFSRLPAPGTDERERNIEFLSEALDAAGEKGPLAVVGFVPPFYPPRVNKSASPRELAARRAASEVGGALRRKGIAFREVEVFQGITDLSFTGFQGAPEELEVLAENVPLWGKGYDLPMEALLKIDIPCVVFGPIGKDAHKITERLELDYSFNVLPFALRDLLDYIFMYNSDGAKYVSKHDGLL